MLTYTAGGRQRFLEEHSHEHDINYRQRQGEQRGQVEKRVGCGQTGRLGVSGEHGAQQRTDDEGDRERDADQRHRLSSALFRRDIGGDGRRQADVAFAETCVRVKAREKSKHA